MDNNGVRIGSINISALSPKLVKNAEKSQRAVSSSAEKMNVPLCLTELAPYDDREVCPLLP